MTAVFPGYQIDCLSLSNNGSLARIEEPPVLAVGCSKLNGNIWNGKLSFLQINQPTEADILSSENSVVDEHTSSSPLVDEKILSKEFFTPCLKEDEIICSHGVTSMCWNRNKMLFIGLDNGDLLSYNLTTSNIWTKSDTFDGSVKGTEKQQVDFNNTDNNNNNNILKGTTVVHHHDVVSGVAYNDTYNYIGSGSWDGRIKITDIKTNQTIQTYTESNQSSINTIAFHSNDPSNITFSANNDTSPPNYINYDQLIASGSKDGYLRIWDLRDNSTQAQAQCLCTVQRNCSVTSLFWGEISINCKYENIPLETAGSPSDSYIYVGLEDGSLSCYDFRKMSGLGTTLTAELWTIRPHEDRINKVIGMGNSGLVTLSDDCSVHLFPGYDLTKDNKSELNKSIYLQNYHNDFARDGCVFLDPICNASFLITSSWDGSIKTAKFS